MRVTAVVSVAFYCECNISKGVYKPSWATLVLMMSVQIDLFCAPFTFKLTVNVYLAECVNITIDTHTNIQPDTWGRLSGLRLS